MSKLQKIYLLVILTLLVVAVGGGLRWADHSLAERRTLLLLSRARSPEELTRLIRTLPQLPPPERLAEIYVRQAVFSFERKDFARYRQMLEHALALQLHPELRGRIRLDHAYSYAFEGRGDRCLALLAPLADDPQITTEQRREAREFLIQLQEKSRR